MAEICQTRVVPREKILVPLRDGDLYLYNLFPEDIEEQMLEFLMDDEKCVAVFRKGELLEE